MDIKNKVIGFIGETSIYDYQIQMLNGVIHAARENNISLVRFTLEQIMNTLRFSSPLELTAKIIEEIQPDGIMFLGWAVDIVNNIQDMVTLINKNKTVPLLSLGRIIENIPSVYINGGEHIKELLEHLYKVHSYENIVFISPITPDDRYQAYEEFMKEHGLFKEELVIHTSEDKDLVDWFFQRRVKRAMEILFDERKLKIDAIMSMYTYEAVVILQELKARGYSVPDDIALTSWEDGESGRYATPPITSVYYPFYEHGYEGCKLLCKMITGEEVPQLNLVPGHMVIRRSCGCFSNKIKLLEARHQNQKTTAPVSTDPLNNDLAEQFSFPMKVLEKKELFNCLLGDIKDETELATIKYIGKYLFFHDTTIENLYDIQKDIFAVRDFITPLIRKNFDRWERAEGLWLKCQIMIEENIEMIFGFSDLLKRENLYNLQYIGQNIISTLDMEQILNVLDESLKKIGINSCHIFLFSNKKNARSEEQLIFSYSNKERASIENIKKTFKSKEQVHDYLFNNMTHIYLIFSLHIFEQLLGYILFEPGPLDDKIYNTLAVELSSAIHGALILKDLKHANFDLQQAHQEIYEQMQEISEKSIALEESNKKLAELDTLKNDFIANITHDFRSPLMVILNSIELGLKFDDLEDSKRTRKRYNTIFSAAIRLKDSIDRLLDLAKMDASGIKLSIQKTPIREYLKNIIDFYKSATIASQIQIVPQLPTYEIENFYTDTEKLDQIIHNLISNALKYINPLEGMIIISLIDQDDAIQIIISDNGSGIPHEKLESIFERFEQAEESTYTTFKGTGIGLAFVKTLVEYLGGSIYAKSEGVGKGASFVLNLKKGEGSFQKNTISETQKTETELDRYRKQHYKDIVEATIQDNLHHNEASTTFVDLNQENEFDPMKAIILIVDDNRYIREILKDYLINAGYKNFIEAANGKEGIDLVYQYKPDLIICDYNMPKIRGDELHDRLVSNPDIKHIPILFLTAIVDRNLMLERKQKGALAYLSKPVDSRELLINVNIHIKKYMEFKKLLLQAYTDKLTGLANRHSLLKFLDDRIMLRSLNHLSVIFIDIDLFKLCNDTYGHQSGDRVLAEIGRTINESLRSYDKAGRYGGEEFVIVLPEATLYEAGIVAKKLQQNIKTLSIDDNGQMLHVTASFGVASLIDNEAYLCQELQISSLKELFKVGSSQDINWKEINDKKKRITDLLIKMADLALYQAKHTYCQNCGFFSENCTLFPDDTCSRCGSQKILPGRDKVVLFDPDRHAAR